MQGDQLAARKCYLAMLTMDEHMQTMSINERRVRRADGSARRNPSRRGKSREVYQNRNEYKGEDETRLRPVPKEEYQCFCMES